MKRVLAAAAMFALGATVAVAQSLDDLNLQIHGYATQGFIYSTTNNWNTTDSTEGTAAWTEAVVNLTVEPQPKLRIGVQARYFLLGNFGNEITIDWAQADYKVNEKFGLRVGKVKSPTGLLNETQDIDPVQLWVLLPQSIYPISSRSSILSHYGGMVYGALPLGERLGKIQYRAYAGERIIGATDGYTQRFRDEGITVPNGIAGPTFGATLKWETPVRGLMLGATEDFERASAAVVANSLPGTLTTARWSQPYFFARYERGRVMAAGEYNRAALKGILQLTGPPPIAVPIDQRSFYVMASYRLSDKLTGGIYYSSAINLQVPVSNARFQKDWNMALRYDVTPYLYLKAEQHVIDGTLNGYSPSDNSSLQPNSRMTLLKLGVSF